MSRSKSQLQQIAEYAVILAVVALSRVLPMGLIHFVLRRVGSVAFAVLGRRRRITLENVRQALGDRLGEAEQIRVARESWSEFALSLPELVKLRPLLTATAADRRIRIAAPELTEILDRVKTIHQETRGCIFVTPHLGNWELLPFVCAALDIPLAVVIRPLDNPYLERLLHFSRRGTRQLFLPKRNTFLPLQQLLAQGKSIGLLPDQSTMKGLPAAFFGRPALTTPVPALLAIYQERPIVVVACCRTGHLRFRGYLSEPIWPAPHGSEKEEALRLTVATNHAMETIIRRHPEQYFWMHNRWKTYD